MKDSSDKKVIDFRVPSPIEKEKERMDRLMDSIEENKIQEAICFLEEKGYKVKKK